MYGESNDEDQYISGTIIATVLRARFGHVTISSSVEMRISTHSITIPACLTSQLWVSVRLEVNPIVYLTIDAEFNQHTSWDILRN